MGLPHIHEEFSFNTFLENILYYNVVFVCFGQLWMTALIQLFPSLRYYISPVFRRSFSVSLLFHQSSFRFWLFLESLVCCKSSLDIIMFLDVLARDASSCRSLLAPVNQEFLMFLFRKYAEIGLGSLSEFMRVMRP